MLKGFRDFLMRGNVVDLAVAVIMGAAFGAVVTSLVEDVFTPIIGALGGQPDFSAIMLGPIRMLKYGTVFLITSLAVNAAAANLWMLALSQVLLGVCMVVMASSFQVLVSEGTMEKRNASINRYSMWMSGGTMIGPLIGGGLASLFSSELAGYRFNFLFSCAVSVLFLLVLRAVSRGYARRRRRADGRLLQRRGAPACDDGRLLPL